MEPWLTSEVAMIRVVDKLRKMSLRSWWKEKWFRLVLLCTTDAPRSAGVEGFLDPIEERCLQWAALRVPDGGTIVEVGSYHGKSAVNLALASVRSGKRHQIFCVDTWRN